jgi:mannose-1-phosphate guanylyltransferase/mannose-6-phosphate isomerase
MMAVKVDPLRVLKSQNVVIQLFTMLDPRVHEGSERGVTVYPVIMCGGTGSRLWPASGPGQPKQFLRLLGERSLFQDTVLRVAGLACGEGQIVVVAGDAHVSLIVEQLAGIGVSARLILEPEGRDSAPAMAAAAAWIARRDPDAIAAFIACDHHIPDGAAFRRAVRDAVGAAREGRIVALGVTPTHPSSAYGYIQPAGPGLAPVAAFAEKPSGERAEACLAAGWLWNSGDFIVSVSTLLGELAAFAPEVLAAASQALPPFSFGAVWLRPVFARAPRISIDHAVMERTRLASVLPVDFAWSDLGAWDAVAATGLGDRGQSLTLNAAGCLIRAPDGVFVAAIGVSNLAIIVDAGAVLVCDLAHSQEVKRLVERLRREPAAPDGSRAADDGALAGTPAALHHRAN